MKMKLPKENKSYYERQLSEFTKVVKKKFNRVEYVTFGKQDMRSSPSITFTDRCHISISQKHFKTSAELFAFVDGYMSHYDNKVWL